MWRRVLLGLTLAVLSPLRASASDETLCAIAPGTYAAAKSSNPDMAFAIAELEKHAVATWYTDRGGADYAGVAKQLLSTCPDSSRVTVVVYGLPNKDCEARESMVGSTIQNSAMYQSFVSTLSQAVGNRKALYIIEPDAVALLADGGCAKQYGYGDNLAIAVRTLSQNPNADLYLDVGYWKLESASDLSNVADIVRGLASQGRIKGITINTSNYRSTSELSGLCGKFIRATSGLNLHCIVDTSRNFNGASSQSEWCNYKNAGIGEIPTGNTGDPNIDYYVWIKPQGESDGTCAGRTSDAMAGPGAGVFFPNFLKQMWNNGALVKNHGMAAIDGTIRQVDSSTPAPTPAPTTPSPMPAPTPSPTPTPTPSPSADNSAEQTSNSTASEDRSLDIPDIAASTAGSAASSKVGATESAEASAGVVSAPDEQEPSFANTPTTSTDSPAQSAGDVQQANTKSGAAGSVSAGIVVLLCLVGVALVALVAVVAIRIRQRSIEETKTPLDPRIHYLSSVPGSISTL